MCSIMGYCDSGVTVDEFHEGFDRTISRGPDDTRILDTGKGLLGFHRLSIMGLHPEGMQPFELDGSFLVCNGEIYGFEKQREALKQKGYSFQSDSDCEILLPLYREYGVEMFPLLDAEFALILFDGQTKEYIAARDPIGIRPLYYGYDKKGTILFASEAKTWYPMRTRLCRSRLVTIIEKAGLSATAISQRSTRSAMTIWRPCAGTFTTSSLPV